MSEPSEIDALRSENETLKKRLDSTTAELQDLLYTLSHDLRGPIRAVMASSMILLEDYGPSLDATASDELKRQSNASRRMNRMLEEILKLSRLSRRTIHPIGLDLSALLKSLAEERGLGGDQLTIEGPAPAFADRELMTSLFEHLLDNSIKFSKPGTPLQIRFETDGETYRFSDNGIGVDPEVAHKVFTVFERLNGDTYPGMGMGLTFAKRIVGMHDGSISIESMPGEGTTILFSLPR